ncbi:hypothetical protein NC652_039880 [Populus alba x Populus x berolinensis]|nr:hypothetical protein NC652_039880 [Populus alba x Populus x berolinensis]
MFQILDAMWAGDYYDRSIQLAVCMTFI